MSDKILKHPINRAAIQRLHNEGQIASPDECPKGIYLFSMVIGGLPENDSRAERLAFFTSNQERGLRAMGRLVEEDVLSPEEVENLSINDLSEVVLNALS